MNLPFARRNMRLARKRSGNAMVEFAIASGLLFAIFSGTFQFGYTFYQYDLLATAVANGARYGSLRPYDSSTSTPSSAYLTAVRNMVVYGSPSGGTTPVVKNLATSNVNVTVAFVTGVPGTVSVSVSNFTVNAIFTQYTMTNKPKVTFAYQGIYSPY